MKSEEAGEGGAGRKVITRLGPEFCPQNLRKEFGRGGTSLQSQQQGSRGRQSSRPVKILSQKEKWGWVGGGRFGLERDGLGSTVLAV